MNPAILFFTLLLLVGATSCQRTPNPGRSSSSVSQSGTQQVFQVKGIIKKVETDGKSIEIRHEEIPDYMPAMTMPFDVKDPKEVAGIKPGDAVSFRLTVTDTDSWIDQVRALSSAGSNPPFVAQPDNESSVAII